MSHPVLPEALLGGMRMVLKNVAAVYGVGGAGVGVGVGGGTGVSVSSTSPGRVA